MSDPVRPDIIILDWRCGYIDDCLSAVDAECPVAQSVHLLTSSASCVAKASCWKRMALRVTLLTENIGFACANNIAVRQSRADWVILLNPDAIVRPGWYAAITAAMSAADTSTACIGSLQLTGDSLLDGVGDSYHVSGIARRVLHGRPAIGVDVRAAARSAFTACAAAAAAQVARR